MNKYKVNIINTSYEQKHEEWVEFETKPEMYKWLTKELNKDKSKTMIFKITQIKE